MRIIFIILFFSLAFATTKASTIISEKRDTILPQVFVIGEYENVYDELLNDYNTLLLSACKNDMTVAFDKWKDMLEALEIYSEEVDYNLYGTKLWLNVFFNKDGTVRYFAYYLKPISKHLDTKEFNRFIESFLKNYRLPFQYKKQFSHYGTAAFPLVPRVIRRKKRP